MNMSPLTLIYVLGCVVELALIVRLWWRDPPPRGFLSVVCAVAALLFVAIWPFVLLPTLGEVASS